MIRLHIATNGFINLNIMSAPNAWDNDCDGSAALHPQGFRGFVDFIAELGDGLLNAIDLFRADVALCVQNVGYGAA